MADPLTRRPYLVPGSAAAAPCGRQTRGEPGRDRPGAGGPLKSHRREEVDSDWDTKHGGTSTEISSRHGMKGSGAKAASTRSASEETCGEYKNEKENAIEWKIMMKNVKTLS